MTEHHKELYYTENMQELIQQIQQMLKNIALTNDSTPPPLSSPSASNGFIGTPQRTRCINELRGIINELHHSDLAYILQALPIEQRWLVWNSIGTECDGKILIEVSNAVRETLIATMSHEELRSATERLDASEIADLAPHIPRSVMREIFKSLGIDEREQLRSAISYPPDTVGAFMDFNILTIRKDVTLETVSRYLRLFDALPNQTDQLFIVDRDGVFEGLLPLSALLVNRPETPVFTLMNPESITLLPDDHVQQAIQAFERYSLISVPVIDEDGKLLGRVPVNAVVNFIRTKAENDELNRAGLHEEEDIFGSAWKSAKNRWMWLSLNLCIAFFASRVIAGFEDTIAKVVALAALLPVIASIAGTSGNQTSAIIIRSLAIGQINKEIFRRLLVKELAISLLNGVVWGGIAGGFAYLLYQNVPLALVMSGAMLLNQLLATLVGIIIPLSLQKLGRDPAVGSNVLLTAITTSGGFFIFLGLATIFLTR